MLIKSTYDVISSKDERGFSLIEVMVAIVIFLIGILGVYQLQIHSTAGNALANRVSAATNWATYVAEELVSRDYDHDDLKDDGSNGMAGLDDMNDPGAPDGELYFQSDGSTSTSKDADTIYSLYWNIAEGDHNTVTGVMYEVKLIRVHVVRNGGIGDGHLYSHNYYKAKWPESPSS